MYVNGSNLSLSANQSLETLMFQGSFTLLCKRLSYDGWFQASEIFLLSRASEKKSPAIHIIANTINAVSIILMISE